MKLTKNILTEMVLKILKEATGSTTGMGDSAVADAQAALQVAKDKFHQHKEAEPPKNREREQDYSRWRTKAPTVYDTPKGTQWYEIPKTTTKIKDINTARDKITKSTGGSKTLTLAKFDDTYGYQAAPSKYYAPSSVGNTYYDATKELKGKFQPRNPVKGAKYGSELKDYTQWKKVSGYSGKDGADSWGNWRKERGKQDPPTYSKTKNVDKTPFEFYDKTGEGGPVSQDVGKETVVEPNNPQYPDWSTQYDAYEADVKSAESDLEQATKDAGTSAGGQSGGGGGGATGGRGGGGRGKGGGRGRGRGKGRGRKSRGRKGRGRGKGKASSYKAKSSKAKGKGKGKGKKGKKKKKKEESLFRILGRDFLNEMNELKKYKK